MKNIWKVGKRKSRHFEKIVRLTNEGDVIFLPPGDYHLLEGMTIKNLTIKGLGKHPSDVNIYGYFAIHNNSKFTLANVTLHAPNKHNALNIKKGSNVHLHKVIIHGEMSGDYPAIWCEESKLNINTSEVYFSEEVDGGIHLSKNADAKIAYSIVNSITATKSAVQLQHTQIRIALTLIENAVATGKESVDFPGVGNLFAIYMNNGARATFDSIQANEHDVTVSLDHAALTVKKADISENTKLIVSKDNKSTLQIEGDEERISIFDSEVQSASANSDDETAETTKVDKETLVETAKTVKNIPTKPKDGKSGMDELNELYGLHDLKKQITKFINTVKFNQSRKEQGLKATPITLHSLFMGNPGTGKTTVARILGRVLYEAGVISSNKFVEVTRKDLVAEYIGQTAPKTQKILEQSKGGILFIDEAYTLNSGSENDFGQEAIDTILTFMEDNRDNTMIIFAGYTDEMNQFLNMNSGLKSRIPNTFYFDDYSAEEVAQIGYENLTNEDYIVDEQKYKEIIKRLYSHSIDKSNARWVRNINEKLIQIMANRVVETGSNDTQTILEEDLDVLTGNERVDKDEKVDELLTKLNNLIGLKEVKDFVHRLTKQVKVDRMLLKDGAQIDKPTYHMIFSGNPGTGKTTVANIIGELFYYLDVLPSPNVKVVDRADLVGPYIGHTEKKTKEVIEQAMGGVLFIDEAYQLTSGSENDFGKQAVETLLTYLENYRDKFIVILAGYTNEMEQFLETNPGLRSRIPLKITFPDYSPDEIATIVEKNVTKNWEVNVPLLKSVVQEIYANLPFNEKSNARWARNFTERLIANHKVWLSEHEAPTEHLKKIHDDVIQEIRGQYVMQ